MNLSSLLKAVVKTVSSTQSTGVLSVKPEGLRFKHKTPSVLETKEQNAFFLEGKVYTLGVSTLSDFESDGWLISGTIAKDEVKATKGSFSITLETSGDIIKGFCICGDENVGIDFSFRGVSFVSDLLRVEEEFGEPGEATNLSYNGVNQWVDLYATNRGGCFAEVGVTSEEEVGYSEVVRIFVSMK